MTIIVHHSEHPSGGVCVKCGAGWPCEYERLVAERDEARAKLAKLRVALESMGEVCACPPPNDIWHRHGCPHWDGEFCDAVCGEACTILAEKGESDE